MHDEIEEITSRSVPVHEVVVELRQRKHDYYSILNRLRPASNADNTCECIQPSKAVGCSSTALGDVRSSSIVKRFIGKSKVAVQVWKVMGVCSRWF